MWPYAKLFSDAKKQDYRAYQEERLVKSSINAPLESTSSFPVHTFEGWRILLHNASLGEPTLSLILENDFLAGVSGFFDLLTGM